MCVIEYYATIKIINKVDLHVFGQKGIHKSPTNYHHRKKVDSAIKWGENMKRQFIKRKFK